MRTLEAIRRAKARGEELSDEEFEVLNQFWKSDFISPEALARPTKYKIGDYPNSPIKDVEAEFGAIVVKKPGLLYCDFCNKEVAHAVATFGAKPEWAKIREQIPESYPPRFTERSVIRNKRVTACPDCADQVRPIFDKDGNYVNHGVKYDYHGQ